MTKSNKKLERHCGRRAEYVDQQIVLQIVKISNSFERRESRFVYLSTEIEELNLNVYKERVFKRMYKTSK